MRSAKLARDRRYALSVLASAYRRDKAAGELLAEFEKMDSLDVDIRRLWIRLLREEGRADDALRLFREAKSSFDSASRRQLLEICRETGRVEVLVGAFEQLIREEPLNLEWRSGLSRHYLESGERERAIAIWNDLGDVEPKQLLAAAYSLQAIGLENVAEQLARRAAKETATRSEALLFVFRMHVDAGRQERALAVLGELGSGNPARGIRASIAEGYERLGRSDLAVETLEALRKELDGFLGTDLEMKYAILLSRVEREEDALKVWRALWSRMRSTPRGRFVEDRMMTVAARTGALAKIAIELEDRLEGGKASTEDVELLVRLYIKVGDPASATEIIEVFLKQTGVEGPEVLRRKAKIYLACHDYHHYEQVIHELVVKDHENRLDHLRELAMSQLERGRRDLTVALLPKIRAESGDNVQMADEFEAGVYGLCGMKGHALEAYVRGIGRHPERIDTYLLISNLMRETGREMEAARMFQFLAQTAKRDDLFTIAIDGILNLRAARNTQVPTKLVRWARRVTLERLATKPHRFYLYRLVTDLAAELNDMPFAIRTLKSALPVAGERRTPVMRELMSKAQMTDPTSRRVFGSTKWTPSKAWDASDYIMVGRRLLGQGDHVPPQTFMSLATVFLREKDVEAAMRTFNRAAEVLEYSEVLREAARVLEDAGRVKQALQYYRRLLATGSDDVGLVLKIGMLEEQRGEQRAAFASYRRGIERVLARKARSVSHVEEVSKDPRSLYRGGNVSADDQALPSLVEGMLLTGSREEVEGFLDKAEERARAEIAALSKGAAAKVAAENRELVKLPRLAAIAQAFRQVALGTRRYERAHNFDVALLAAFPGDRKATIDAFDLRSRKGLHGQSERLLSATPLGEDPSVRLAAGVIDVSVPGLRVAAAAKLIPSMLGEDKSKLVDLLERVDTGRMDQADQAAIPTLIACCALVGAGDAAERFARAGLRHSKLTELRPTFGGMSSILTIVDRLSPGSGRRLLREKMSAVAASKPTTMSTFLYQFAEIDASVGGGTLDSDAATALALSLAKDSERYNYYLTTLLAYVDQERRAQVAKEIHNTLPRSQRAQYLISCMDYLGHEPVEESYVEWFGIALKDALENGGDNIIGGARLPIGRFSPFVVTGNTKRAPELMLEAIEAFAKFKPGPEVDVARVTHLVEQKKFDEAQALTIKAAVDFAKEPSKQRYVSQIVSAWRQPGAEKQLEALVKELKAKLPGNPIVARLRSAPARRGKIDYAAQVDILRKQVAAKAEGVSLLSRLASLELRYGWLADARERYQKLAKLQPENPFWKQQVSSIERRLQYSAARARKAELALESRGEKAAGKDSQGGKSKPVQGRTSKATPGRRAARSARPAGRVAATRVAATRVVSTSTAMPITRIINPQQAQSDSIQKLFDAGKVAEARAAFRRLWRNFNPANQYIRFPQNLMRYTRIVNGVPQRSTLFSQFEKLPFVAEEARAALRILGLNQASDPYGLIVPPVHNELLDLVARDLGKDEERAKKTIEELSARVLDGSSNSDDVGILLRLVDAKKVKLADALAKSLLDRAELASTGRLQRLARLCSRRKDPARGEQLLRLSVLLGNVPPVLGTLRKQVEEQFGDGARELLLKLVDDLGAKSPSNQFTAWATSAVKLWSELLPPEEAAARMAKLKQRQLRLAKASRYVSEQTPGADVVAATFARCGRYKDALSELEPWLRQKERDLRPRVIYGRRIHISPQVAMKTVTASTGAWKDRAAWLRELAGQVLEWQSNERLVSPDLVLGQLGKALAGLGSAEAELAKTCVDAMSTAGSRLPAERAAYAEALRSVGREAEADKVDETLLGERALPIARIAKAVERIIARDGPAAGIEVGSKATEYTHVPSLLQLLIKTAEGIGQSDQLERWRLLLPPAPKKGAKKGKAAPSSDKRKPQSRGAGRR